MLSVYLVKYKDGTTNKIISNIEYIHSNSNIVEYEKMSDINDEKKPIVDTIALLKAQLQAQTERSDFIEDCIAEMAGVVYNTEETT